MAITAELPAFVWTSERQQRHVSGSLDRNCQRSLVLGAGAHFAPGFYLAPLTNVTAEPGKVLIVNVLDVVDGKCRYLAARSVASTTARSASPAARAPAVAAFPFAATATALALRATEARSTWATFALRARRPIFSFLGVVRHGC